MTAKESLQNYVNIIPGMKDILNPGADEEEILKLKEMVGDFNIDELVSVLKIANGEQKDSYFGVMGGLEFLGVKDILFELDFFRTVKEELMVVGTTAIEETAVMNQQWIPIAFDNSRCYLAMDLQPTKDGKAGQIVSVDTDYNKCYLVAESLADLFARFTKWYREGILVLEQDGDIEYLTESTGSIFNSLDELAMMDMPKEQLVPVNEAFWLKRYEDDLIEQPDGTKYISTGRLAKEIELKIEEQNMSCALIQHMINLKVLCIYNSQIEDIELLAKLPKLCTLRLWRSGFGKNDLSALKNMTRLKKLCVSDMSGKGLQELHSVENLKELRISEMREVEADVIGRLTQVETLYINHMDFQNADFISNMRKLKDLEFEKISLKNLDFLYDLKELEKFKLLQPAEEESGLAAIRDMLKLEEFKYPVKDISVYAGHPNIKEVYFTSEVEDGFEIFAGSKVTSFTICGKTTKEHMKEINDKMNQYVKISSYGGVI